MEQIEDMKYWIDSSGLRIWQNKTDHKIKVTRHDVHSDTVQYTKNGIYVGIGMISDFKNQINDYYPISPLGISMSEINSCADTPDELFTEHDANFDDELMIIHIDYIRDDMDYIVERDVVDYDISDNEGILEIIHKDGSITYYNLSNVLRFEVTNKERED